MDIPASRLPLTIPVADELVTRPNISLLQPKVLWSWPAPSIFVNLASDLVPPDLKTNRTLHVHATYTGSYSNQFLFGFHHLHALVSQEGEFNCQEIENYRGRLNHHLGHLPPRHYIIPDLAQEEGSYSIDFTRLLGHPPEILSGETFFGSPIEPENWGMWLLNGLLSAFTYVANGQPGRYLCYAPYKWQTDLLQFIGISPDRIVQQKPWKTYFCERISLIQYSRVDLIPDLYSRAVFANIIKRCTDAEIHTAEKIFISRRSVTKKLGGTYRALLNEAELIEALEQRGYKVVEPELLSFRQQVRLFNAARIVVGLGGAAMFNTVFCDHGTKVVSIESTGAFALGHARLFAALGLAYGFIFGQQDATDGRYPHNSWTIDVAETVKAIESFEYADSSRAAAPLRKNEASMKRPVVLGTSPWMEDYYRKDYAALFRDTGSNTGNQAINFGLACQLPENTRFLPGGTSIKAIRENGDVLVLPMANFLGKHTDLGRTAAFLDELDMPVIGLGLGAQAASQRENITLTPGTVKWLQAIARHAPSNQPNLGLRGTYTADQLAQLGFPAAGRITGCPSNFINPDPDLAKKLSEGFARRPRHIAVSAGIQFAPELAKIERELADIVTLTGGAYIVQHGIDMVQIARNAFDDMDPARLKTCHDYIMPNSSLDEFKSWCRRYAYAFFDSVAWMDFLRRFDFVVGTRFHGAMFAIQAGVPAGCIAHDSRTMEMCETMAIPVRHYKEINGALTQHNVFDYFQFNAEHYVGTRKKLHEHFMQIYQAAEIEVRPSFRKML